MQPREYFPISRLINDPSDSTVYFVRAIVRNARTGVTIDTVNLTSLGSGIWAYSWQAPADPSGQGLFISITTIVYTDSGYTTLSDNYGQEQDTYLVYDRFKFVAGLAQQISAIGSGPDIDYAKIRKILDAAVSKALDPVKTAVAEISKAIAAIEMPELKATDLGPVLEGLMKLEKALKPLGKLQNTDLTGLTAAVNDARNQIGAIKFPDFPKQKETDLSPVIKAIADKQMPTIDHDQIITALLPELRSRLKEIVTPEFMDSFIRQGMSSSMFADVVDRAGGKDRTPKPYKKIGNRFVRS